MLTPEARQWKEMVGILAMREMKRLGLSQIVREKFSLDCVIYWAKDKRFDCDNLLKMLQDSMGKIVYSNDRYCVPRVLDYAFDDLKPCVQFTISCPPTILCEIS